MALPAAPESTSSHSCERNSPCLQEALQVSRCKAWAGTLGQGGQEAQLHVALLTVGHDQTQGQGQDEEPTSGQATGWSFSGPCADCYVCLVPREAQVLL